MDNTGYHVYLDKMLFPVAPSKMTITINNNNKVVTLINESDVNILKDPGLSDITFEAEFPNQEYSFAEYKGSYRNADYFLRKLKKIKTGKKHPRFIIYRDGNDSTKMRVSLEDAKIMESSDEGNDVKVSIKLKQYKDYGTKICKVIFPQQQQTATAQATTENVRETENSPAPSSPQTYTVQKNDTLSKIAKQYYGNASQYTKIFNANRDKISNPNLIRTGQVLVIPA